MDRLFKRFVTLTPREGSPSHFPETVIGTLRQIYRLDAGRWTTLLTIATVAAFIEPCIMWMVGKFVDDISSGTIAPQNALTHPMLIGVIVFFLIVLPLIDSIENTLHSLFINTRSVQRTRFRAVNYLTRQSMEFFSNEMAGRLTAKAFDFSRAAGDFMLTLTTQTWYVVVFFLGTLFFCLNAHWALGAMLLAWGCVSVLLICVSTPIIARRSERTVESYSTAMGRSVDILSNISLTKLFSKPESENTGFMSLLNDHLVNVFYKNKAVAVAVALIYVTNGIAVAGIIYFSIYLWTSGQIAIGTIVSLFPLVLRIRVQTDWLFMQASMLSEQYGTILNGIEVLRRPITVNDRPGALPMPRGNGAIEFRNVRFGYSADRQIFSDLTLSVPAGQKIGLVGPSGAGKTTLVNLLLRFYDIDHGKIEIDGHDIAAITQDSLRDQIGMVTQDSGLLNRSIADNIRYGRPGASMEDVREAAIQAAADDFIPHLRDQTGLSGYDAQVGERGVRLSGGQRQRIAIARLILKDAPIMLLDEATSALDSEVEAAVQAHIYPLMQNRTVIAIAHRLSTLVQMDRIVVLDQGRIVEDGPHAALLAQGGLYARLWNRQSQGFLGD